MTCSPQVASGTTGRSLRSGVFGAMRPSSAPRADPRSIKLQQEDVCGRMSFVLSARLLDPSSGPGEGLNSRRRRSAGLGDAARPLRDLAQQSCLEAGKAIAELAIKAASARRRTPEGRRRPRGSRCCPSKLRLRIEDIANNELFLVGATRRLTPPDGPQQGPRPSLPLHQVQNAWEVDPDRLLANNEIHDIAVALGSMPTARTAHPIWAALRCSKVVIMSGRGREQRPHRTLLLTLFFPSFSQASSAATSTSRSHRCTAWTTPPGRSARRATPLRAR